MKIGKYFTTNLITKGLIIAILLCAFIYIEHFKLLSGYYLIFANSILGILGIFLLLRAKTPVWFYAGFFMGVFWLWWLGVSFYYYKLIYLVPISILLIGLSYGVIFLILGFLAKFVAKKIENRYPLIEKSKTIYFLRAIAIILLFFIQPFGFDWLKPPLIFIDSAFGVELWQFGLIVLTLALFLTFKKWYILALILLAIDLKNPKVLKPNSLRDIELVYTNINMQDKWLPKNQPLYTKLALFKIDEAIKKGKKLIILPESLLPYFLNLETPYLEQFLERSKKITIVIGSLYFVKENDYKNSAYIIKNGEYKIANKVVLVPFGEANPLPEWMGWIVNKIFFDGSVDYGADKNFTYMSALDKKYKIAICYEGTNAKTYEDNPEFLILISNDGWFKPSIEPTLQELLLKYYSKLHNTTIYHSINGSRAYIVVPHPNL